jgi:hypothetical protein
MHILESFSLFSGSKIKTPWINQKIFPCDFSKFIIVNSSSNVTGANFSNYTDLLNILNKELERREIGIIFFTDIPQVFNAKNIKLMKASAVDPNHLAYLIQNSELVVSGDEFSIAIASYLNVPNIFIGDNESMKGRGAFFGKDSSETIGIDKNNKIEIEDITKRIFLKLKINNTKELSIKTIYRGELYNDKVSKIIEVTPEQILPQSVLPGFQLLNIRIDYLKRQLLPNDYKSMFENLKIRKCSIITDRSFNIGLFSQLKEQVNSIIYDVTNELDNNFVKECLKITKNVILLHTEKNEENKDQEIRDQKLLLVDNPIPIKKVKKDSADIQIDKNMFFKSKKLIFSKNKVYLSKASLDSDLAIDINTKDHQEINTLKKEDLETLKSEDADCILIFKNA